MACNTGIVEVARMPKTRIVVVAQTSTHSRCVLAPLHFPPTVEEQGIVKPQPHDQQERRDMKHGQRFARGIDQGHHHD